jgi:hypothetical protein
MSEEIEYDFVNYEELIKNICRAINVPSEEQSDGECIDQIVFLLKKHGINWRLQ